MPKITRERTEEGIKKNKRERGEIHKINKTE